MKRAGSGWRAAHVLEDRAARAFRVARPSSRRRLVTKTGVQVVVVWGFALGLLPMLAVRVDRLLGLRPPSLRYRVPIGGALFAAGSACGLRAAWVMADDGKGTPLPFDAARELVVAGPYRFVRNPMAMSAVAQSTGIAVALGSPTAGLIPVGGALVWNVAIRPSEERFLAERFGDAYLEYQRRVRCWVPTRPERRGDGRPQSRAGAAPAAAY